MISEAIEILREYEPEEGYYLAISAGGKDSMICYDLLEKSGVKFDAHYNVTTIDPPEALRHLKKHYPKVIWHYPIYKGKPTNYYQLIRLKGLPLRQMKWCCEVLKEYGGFGRLMIDGIRSAESLKRSRRVKKEYFLNKYYKKKYKGKNVPDEILEELVAKQKAKYVIHIIFEWTDKDVWDYIKAEKLPYCELYDRGWERIGCIGCPESRKKDIARAFNTYPIIKRNIIKAIQRTMDIGRYYLEFNDAEDVFNWWISKKSVVDYFADKLQIKLDI